MYLPPKSMKKCDPPSSFSWDGRTAQVSGYVTDPQLSSLGSLFICFWCHLLLPGAHWKLTMGVANVALILSTVYVYLICKIEVVRVSAVASRHGWMERIKWDAALKAFSIVIGTEEVITGLWLFFSSPPFLCVLGAALLPGAGLERSKFGSSTRTVWDPHKGFQKLGPSDSVGMKLNGQGEEAKTEAPLKGCWIGFNRQMEVRFPHLLRGEKDALSQPADTLLPDTAWRPRPHQPPEEEPLNAGKNHNSREGNWHKSLGNIKG